jgi:hypothetical protein
VLSDNPDGFEIRWPIDPNGISATYRLGKWLQDRSLFAKLLVSRIQLLRGEGIALNTEGAASRDRASTKSTRSLNENDLPSDWPPAVLQEAQLLTRRILARFAAAVRDDGREFFVLYVPRGNDEVDGNLPLADRWLPWLRETTAALGITLLDPTSALAARQTTGTPTYDDHWSPAGHEVIANYLADSLCDRLAALTCD